MVVGYIKGQFYWFGSVRYQMTMEQPAYMKGWEMDFLEYAEIR